MKTFSFKIMVGLTEKERRLSSELFPREGQLTKGGEGFYIYLMRKMEEILTKEFIFSVIVLLVTAILLVLDKISQEVFVRVLLLLIGAMLGIGYGYYKALRKDHD